MGYVKTKVHSDEYAVDGYFWLDADDTYRVSFVHEGKEYVRVLDKKNIVPEQYVSDYAWMKLEDFYSDVLLGVAEEEDNVI